MLKSTTLRKQNESLCSVYLALMKLSAFSNYSLKEVVGLPALGLSSTVHKYSLYSDRKSLAGLLSVCHQLPTNTPSTMIKVNECFKEYYKGFSFQNKA